MNIDDTASRLQKMGAGQRAWFSFCPSLVIDKPRVIVHFLRDDPDGQGILKAQRALSDQAYIMGMASLNADGRLQLLAPSLNRSHLENLASWVKANVAEHSSLSIFKNCVLSDVRPTGMVLDQYEDDGLWRDVPDHLVPYTLEESLFRIRKLKPGREYWFWLTDNGPLGTPFFYISPARKDPSGERLKKHLLHVQKQIDGPSRSFSGVLKADEESILLMTSDAAKDMSLILNGLYQQDTDRYSPLSKLRIVQNNKGSLTALYTIQEAAQATTSAPALDLKDLCSFVQQAQQGEPLYFWFGEGLLLHSDRGALRAQAKQMGGSGVRGELRQSPKGWFEFRTKKAAPGFILSLATWVNQHNGDWAALKALHGSRWTQRDDEGKILARQKDDAAWT